MQNDDPYLIIDKVSDRVNSDFSIYTQDACKGYKQLLHYSNVDTLNYILCDKKTLKLSSLTNILLNDQEEQERQDIKKFAQGYFVSCFCHCQSEKKYFWDNYGGTDNKSKILLKFRNFSECFERYIFTDYFITGENKKMSFGASNITEDTGQRMSINLFGQSLTGRLSVPAAHTEYDLRNWIQFIDILDVEYVLEGDSRITDNYSTLSNLSFKDSQIAQELVTYKTIPLAKYKTSKKWGVEEETRIVCKLHQCSDISFDHLLLRLKDEIFEGLEIVINPWVDNNDLEQQIQNIKNLSPINEKIKNTIKISKVNYKID